MILRRIGAQITVIWALAIRELQVKGGGKRFGYLRTLRGPLMLLAFFLLLRPFLFGRMRTTPQLFVTGIMLYTIYTQLVRRGLSIGAPLGGVFTFSNVTVLDVLLASALLIWNTLIPTMCILITLFHVLGNTVNLDNWVYFIAGPINMLFVGLGAALVIWVMALHFPYLKPYVTIFNRVLFFTSGVFFSPTMLSESAQKIVEWNPLTVCIEMTRYGVGISNSSDFNKPFFSFITSLILCSVGWILANNTTRKYRQ